MLNNVRENVRLLIDQEIEKWDIEIYTFVHKVGQLTNDLAALAKNHNHLCGLLNVEDNVNRVLLPNRPRTLPLIQSGTPIYE